MKQRIENLVKQLNIYSDAYYNRVAIVDDVEFDRLYEELVNLEKETGYVLPNSPTRNVGFEVVSQLEKVEHKNKLYSLSKTKNASEIEQALGSYECVSSLKLDGLTTEIEYKNGELFRASTRGDGLIGEDITHSVKVYRNIPNKLPFDINITVVGESIIKLGDFENFNNKLNEEERFKNPRNAVSGTVRNLDSKVVKDRAVRFIAFDITEIDDNYKEDTYKGTLKLLSVLGFNTVPNVDGLGELVFEQLKKYAKLTGFGIDGVVVRINDNNTYNSKGFNAKFPLGAKAFKFADEVEETTLTNIEWSIGRTGVLTPVAVFEPVDLEGTTVERASLHNLSQIENLNLGGTGSIVKVQKSNQIIPQIVEVVERVGDPNIPLVCPYCEGEVNIRKDNLSKVVECSNIDCTEKLVMAISYYVSRPCLNIRGLSEQHIRTFINHGLLKSINDIYTLKDKFDYIKSIEGFGQKSAKHLIDSIEKSKNAKLDKFICGLGITHIGATISKEISKYSLTLDKFLSLSINECKDICGDVKGESLYEYITKNKELVLSLADNINFEKESVPTGALLSGKTFCITGSCVEFKNRGELKSFIENNGGKVVTGVTSKTNYLISNEVEDSTKYKKAIDLNVKIISEKDLKCLCS